MPRQHIIRKTVDVTETQAAALQAMIAQAEQATSQQNKTGRMPGLVIGLRSTRLVQG